MEEIGPFLGIPLEFRAIRANVDNLRTRTEGILR